MRWRSASSVAWVAEMRRRSSIARTGRSFFWDGRTTLLEEQVLKPIEDPAEMGSSVKAAARRVGVAPDELARALASYVRSILSGNSRFDRYVAGDRCAQR